MELTSQLDSRDLLSFPPGDNSSDTFIDGFHYNLTTLEHWNYTYYSNRTISNESRCYLTFDPYTPHLLQNGTFVNSTSCYSPILGMGARSKVGLGLGIAFFISIMFTVINLRKHGKIALPTQTRFHPVGRRWQWYWMLVVGTCGFISGVTGVDVDRYYLPELPLALTNIFWFAMLPSTMAVVWESVRHWGTWQERQMIDPRENQFALRDNDRRLRDNDRRSRVETWIPLVFYFFYFLYFLMIVPRSWTSLWMQRDANQAQLIAEPAATDVRFKLGAFFLVGGWLTTVFSLQHSIFHYKSHRAGIFNRVISIFKYAPTKLLLTLFISLLMIGYVMAISFYFPISPLKLHPLLDIMYPLAWGPIALILLIYETAGYIDPNEDGELIRQRRIREAAINSELGITQKPAWWRRLHGDNRDVGVQERIRRNVTEVGGNAPTASAVEMQDISTPTRSDDHLDSSSASINSERRKKSVRFSDEISPTVPHQRVRSMLDIDTPYRDELTQPGDSEASSMTQVEPSRNDGSTDSSVTISAPPQQVRSMLDIG